MKSFKLIFILILFCNYSFPQNIRNPAIYFTGVTSGSVVNLINQSLTINNFDFNDVFSGALGASVLIKFKNRYGMQLAYQPVAHMYKLDAVSLINQYPNHAYLQKEFNEIKNYNHLIYTGLAYFTDYISPMFIPYFDVGIIFSGYSEFAPIYLKEIRSNNLKIFESEATLHIPGYSARLGTHILINPTKRLGLICDINYSFFHYSVHYITNSYDYFTYSNVEEETIKFNSLNFFLSLGVFVSIR